MNAHVNQLCKSASFSLRRVGQVRRNLDHVTTEKLTHALITSKLDQCNSLLYGLPEKSNLQDLASSKLHSKIGYTNQEARTYHTSIEETSLVSSEEENNL